MAEITENKKVFFINQIESPKDIHEIASNLMMNSNLAPFNCFNDFGDKGLRLGRLVRDPKLWKEILTGRTFLRYFCFGATSQAEVTFRYNINFTDPHGQYGRLRSPVFYQRIAQGVTCKINEPTSASLIEDKSCGNSR